MKTSLSRSRYSVPMVSGLETLHCLFALKCNMSLIEAKPFISLFPSPSLPLFLFQHVPVRMEVCAVQSPLSVSVQLTSLETSVKSTLKNVSSSFPLLSPSLPPSLYPSLSLSLSLSPSLALSLSLSPSLSLSLPLSPSLSLTPFAPCVCLQLECVN